MGWRRSYAGRARELANKGMLQEALVVWRNRSSLCGKPLAEGPYLDWLLRTGEHDAALRLLTPTRRCCGDRRRRPGNPSGGGGADRTR
jgi:hypothetical protein